MVRLDPGGGVDGDGVDFFGRVVRDGFDVHAALGRGDDRDAAGGAVDEQGEGEFLLNVGGVCDVEAVYLLDRGAGWGISPRVAQQFLGVRFTFHLRLGNTA